jgi:hypothetical protein
LRRFKKKNISIQGWGDLSFCGELGFTLSLLFLSASITVTTCRATISLEPCALNGDFQHFIPRSNKFHYFVDTPARRVWGEERRPKDRVTLQLILVFTLTVTHPKTVTLGCVSVCDKYLHWPRVSVKNLDM